jgi:hypothetical protein
LLPAALLALALGMMVARDWTLPEEEDPLQGTDVVELPIDPDPRLLVRFDPFMQFGLAMAREKDSAGNPKKLTYSDVGATNNTCLLIDGKERPFGHGDAARWQEKEGKLGTDRGGRRREGRQSVWLPPGADRLPVTQTVEVVAGEQVAPGQRRRLLETCLVRYKVENKDGRPHRVGLRFLLDTYIGSNDGVPFTVGNALCDTEREFNTPAEVPDFIQALERPDLDNPGTVAHLTLKPGGRLEPPTRVTLGHWSNTLSWDVPVTPMRQDSAVVLYWDEKEIKPGEVREVGFAYGLGNVSSGAGGKLGVTAGGSLLAGAEFTVTAYVNTPLRDQTVTLQLPPGLERTAGPATQPVKEPEAGGRNSAVTWKVKAARSGRYTLRVTSSTGVAQTLLVTITNESIF